MISDYKLVESFTMPHEAHLARAKLASEGIPSQILDEYTFTMDWFYANAVGGIKLVVPQNYYEKAIEALADDYTDEMNNINDTYYAPLIWWDDQDEEENPSESITADVICPFCDSSDVEITKSVKKRSWLSFFTLGFVPPPTQNSYLCHICLNEWQET